MKLDRLPKYAPPEETNVMAMMDRMRVVELQMNEVQDLSIRNRECIVKNARHICEVGSRNSGADKPSFKLTVSVNDMGKVLDADFWPEGIMVRR